MYACFLCRFSVPLDDTLVTTVKGSCICLRCYLRTVEDERSVPRNLERAILAVTAAV